MTWELPLPPQVHLALIRPVSRHSHSVLKPTRPSVPEGPTLDPSSFSRKQLVANVTRPWVTRLSPGMKVEPYQEWMSCSDPEELCPPTVSGTWLGVKQSPGRLCSPPDWHPLFTRDTASDPDAEGQKEVLPPQLPHPPGGKENSKVFMGKFGKVHLHLFSLLRELSRIICSKCQSIYETQCYSLVDNTGCLEPC